MRTPILLLTLLLLAPAALPAHAAEPVKDQATIARENDIQRVLIPNRLEVAKARALLMQGKKNEAQQIIQNAQNAYRALNSKYPDQPQVLVAIASADAAMNEARGTGSRDGSVDDTYKKAEDLVSKSIAAAPTRASLYAERASIRNQRGDKAGAVADYKKALEMEPENSEWARLMNLIEPQPEIVVPDNTTKTDAPTDKSTTPNWYNR